MQLALAPSLCDIFWIANYLQNTALFLPTFSANTTLPLEIIIGHSPLSYNQLLITHTNRAEATFCQRHPHIRLGTGMSCVYWMAERWQMFQNCHEQAWGERSGRNIRGQLLCNTSLLYPREPTSKIPTLLVLAFLLCNTNVCKKESIERERGNRFTGVTTLLTLTNQCLLQLTTADTQSLQYVIIWKQLKGRQAFLFK